MAHILIVEDDPVINDLLAFIMEQDNYILTRALDGKAALGLALQERPDLILMDLRLPTVDGGDAIRILKSNPETREIPIIAVSASSTLRAEAAGLPVDAVISKPFDVDSLLAEVVVQLQRSAAYEATPIPARLDT
ncbi:MAG TPA: response regulator [Thermomicrobiales bacterium]|nr:response regulator [Thermomicrobiales bacterium]